MKAAMLNRSARSFPYLSGYLKDAAEKLLPHERRWAWTAGIAAALSITSVLAALILQATAIEVTFIAIVGAVVGASASSFWHRRLPIDPHEDLRKESKRVAQKLHESLKWHKLHKELHPVALELLEASARNWKRVQTAVSGPGWNDRSLPSHWSAWRQKAKTAADLAMAEIVLSCENTFYQREAPANFGEVVASALESVGILEPTFPMDLLPAEFEQARGVAYRLADLADEIERVSVETLRAQDLPTGSAQALDSALGDLRTIREAESEVEQHLEQGK